MSKYYPDQNQSSINLFLNNPDLRKKKGARAEMLPVRFCLKDFKVLFSKYYNTLSGTITHVLTDKKIAALTFDDGPHPAYTPELLNILKYYGVKASFFLIGELAYENPEIVRKIARENHAICHHSWNHIPFTDMTLVNFIDQIRKCNKTFYPYALKILRPPYGYQSIGSHLYLSMMGFKVVTWNVNGRDWTNDDEHQIAERLSNKVKPGCIILLHDNLYDALSCEYVKRDNMLNGLIKFLELHAESYQFVTVPKLLKSGKPRYKKLILRPDQTFINSLNRR